MVHEGDAVTPMGKAKAIIEYRAENGPLVNHLIQALKAESLYKKDVDYAVVDDQVMIIDEFTGRILEGRRWSEGLHQAVEAKEGVKIKEENQTLATITLQNYFRMYDKLAGMTGTAQTEAAELMNTYGLIDSSYLPQADWIVERNLKVWQDISGYIDRRQLNRYAEGMIGEVGQTFNYNRQALLDSIGRLSPTGESWPEKRSVAHVLTFPPQEHKIGEGQQTVDRATLKSPGTLQTTSIVWGDVDVRTSGFRETHWKQSATASAGEHALRIEDAPQHVRNMREGDDAVHVRISREPPIDQARPAGPRHSQIRLLATRHQRIHWGTGYFLGNPSLCITVDMYDKFDFI